MKLYTKKIDNSDKGWAAYILADEDDKLVSCGSIIVQDWGVDERNALGNMYRALIRKKNKKDSIHSVIVLDKAIDVATDYINNKSRKCTKDATEKIILMEPI
jgi:hypothetical protein